MTSYSLLITHKAIAPQDSNSFESTSVALLHRVV